MLWDKLATAFYTRELAEVHLNVCMEHSPIYSIMPTSDSAAEPRRRAQHAIHELCLHFQMKHSCTIFVIVDNQRLPLDELLSDNQKQLVVLDVTP